jgi:methionyl-tRNA formyltransferase
MKTVLVLGKGTLAIRVAKWFLESPTHELVAVVPVVPEPDWTDSLLRWSEATGIVAASSGSYEDIPAVRDEGWRVDLAWSVFYDKLLPSWFIAKCGRILNLHNSPLPRYRGVSPINWALKNGETKHGVTIHEITPGIDDGPVVAQIEYSIYPNFDEVRDVYNRALEYGWTLFEQTMPILDRISARPQNDAQASYYSADQNELLGDRRGFTRREARADAASELERA